MNIYTIRKGDTLSRIAQKAGLTLGELVASNPQITDPDRIFPGMAINLPEHYQPDFVDQITGQTPWFEIAKKEMEEGVDEIKGLNHNNPRIIEYHQTTSLKATNDETPWCSAFVNWCLKQAGLKGTGSAMARSWLKWGTTITNPVKGCIVILERGNDNVQGHVGFYFGDDGNRLLMLGGNQSDSVNISSYPKQKVLGYRLPADFIPTN